MCFRAKGPDKLNQKLLSAINDSGKMHMVPAKVNQKYTIRFALAAPNANTEDVGKINKINSYNNFKDIIISNSQNENKK